MSHLEELVIRAKNAINQALDVSTLENIRIKYLGKKGYLTLQMKSIRDLPPEERSEIGAFINKARKQIQQVINTRKIKIEKSTLDMILSKETIDISLPGRRIENGTLHPITTTIDFIENFFFELGFIMVTGPEIEDSYHNFDALNIPSYHPVRAAQDTFWFDTTRLLRTQTSNVQIRTMKNQQPPIRIVSSGRVYRNDYDKTHTPMFHQIEGLIVDQDINFADLKETLCNFLHNFFEEKLQINFRPSYFPFTEPSAEVDVMNKNGKWLEVLGCGMVHPNVLNNVDINPEIYSGFAFGMGIERLTMARYGITDLRTFFKNDLRFLEQFK